MKSKPSENQFYIIVSKLIDTVYSCKTEDQYWNAILWAQKVINRRLMKWQRGIVMDALLRIKKPAG